MVGTYGGALTVVFVFTTTSLYSSQIKKKKKKGNEIRDAKTQVCHCPLEGEGRCCKIWVYSNMLWKQ